MFTAPKAKNGKTRLPVRWIGDQFLLTDKEAWTFLKIPTVRYEFLDADSRKEIADHFYLALASLLRGNDPVEAMLLQTHRPLDLDAWDAGWQRRVEKWQSIGARPAPGWHQYRQAMREHMAGEEYLIKEVYVGICLGERAKVARTSWSEFLSPLRKGVEKAEDLLDIDNFHLSVRERDEWDRRARDVHRSLGQSHIAAVPASAEEVAWLYKKPLHPHMDCPAPSALIGQEWGPTDVTQLGEGYIDNKRRHLAITQVDWDAEEEVTGYTATLCFSRFPDVLYFPAQEPWMHFASALAHPVDLVSRFTLVPAQKVAKDVGRKLNEAKDQATHIAESGSAVPLEVQEQYERAMALEYTISRDRQPWVYGRHRLRVSASSASELTARVRRVIEHYKDLSIDISWPSGDQFDLLLEAMPGGPVVKNGYYQRQELHMIGGGMPTASAQVGDKPEVLPTETRGWTGAFIGETTSRVRTPVFFSPHVAMARNSPNGVAIIGAPGGGKSYLAFTLARDVAEQGVWTIYIDPKADAKPMADLPGLGNPRVFDLRDGHDGMLDPFSLADDLPSAKLLALETTRLLLGALEPDKEEALIAAVEAVAAAAEPSLSKVVSHLENGATASARTLGMVLRNVRDLPFARLCFAPQGAAKISAEDGLTIITLLGLDLPEADTQRTDYSWENRLAVGVMYLLTRYARRLMLSANKEMPKAIFVDESWAITSTPQGKRLMPEIARMGRSHNTALVMITQNAEDLSTQAIANSISTTFAFRAKNGAEIDNVLKFMGLEINEGNRSTIRELFNGECLMKDVDGRVARVQVVGWDPVAAKTYESNPDKRESRQEREEDVAPNDQDPSIYAPRSA